MRVLYKKILHHSTSTHTLGNEFPAELVYTTLHVTATVIYNKGVEIHAWLSLVHAVAAIVLEST